MDAQSLCDFLCPEDEFGNHRTVFIGQIVDTPDVIPGNQEYVDRRLRMDILKSDDRLTLVNELGGFFTPDDLAENALFHFRLPRRLSKILGTRHAGC